MIKEEGYMDVAIVGHSSDDDSTVFKLFQDAGADYFETKPTNLKNFK
jgi:hypothetical protein